MLSNSTKVVGSWKSSINIVSKTTNSDRSKSEPKGGNTCETSWSGTSKVLKFI